jgi:hypothetical protein
VYFWSSSQHSANPLLKAPAKGIGQNFSNTVATSMLFRAMLDAMDRWATDGVAPSTSRVPARSDGTLMDYAVWQEQFPVVPGVMPLAEPNVLPLLDFGPDAAQGILRDLRLLRVAGTIRTVGRGCATPYWCRRSIGMATMSPVFARRWWRHRWGPTLAGTRVPAAMGMARNGGSKGAISRFPIRHRSGAATGDPRLSVLERYPERRAYVAAITRAAQELVIAGLMLEEDVARCAAAAERWDPARHVVRL